MASISNLDSNDSAVSNVLEAKTISDDFNKAGSVNSLVDCSQTYV